MSDEAKAASGPDFSLGVDISDLAGDALLRGHVAGTAAVLVRRGDAFFLVGAECTHYHGPLDEGIVVGDEIRCPWHHARFNLRTGRAQCAPAFDPLPTWRIERAGNHVFARERQAPAPTPTAPANAPRSIVIVGAGAAGFAAAHTLREEGYAGALTLIGADPSAPYDRPNLSKDYLAGAAPEDWLPLRDAGYYNDQHIDLRLNQRVTKIDTNARRVEFGDGAELSFDNLLLATGAEPVRLSTPGIDLPHVHYLRTLADSRAIIAACATATSAVVIGASFIGLEVAASLRMRGLTTHVVAPEAAPMERILGPDFARFIRSLHEEHGVIFHLSDTVASIDPAGATLAKGERIAADLIVVGVGVRPVTTLAQDCGLAIERGVLVNEYLETSAPGIYAAGDIARWPDRRTGERIRVEHWAVAERQGQTAARNMLGRKERFDAAPFFWSQHYDATICYVGHAEAWDRTQVSGSMEGRDCAVAYYRGDQKLALATLFRDLESLREEVSFERATQA